MTDLERTMRLFGLDKGTPLQELSRRLNMRWFPPLEIRCTVCRSKVRKGLGW